jgi:hypothetical protein
MWQAAAWLPLDPRAARRLLEEAVAMADEIGAPPLRWFTRCWSVTHLASRGQLDEAEAANAECLELGTAAGEPDAAELFAGVSFGIARLRGMASQLADVVGAVARQYPKFQAWRGAQLWALCEAGRLDEARAVLGTIDRDAMTQEPQPLLGPSYLARAAEALDDADLATFVRKAVLPFADLWAHGHVVIWGPASWALGLAAWTLGDRREARDRLNQAVDACRHEGLVAIAELVERDMARLFGNAGEATG